MVEFVFHHMRPSLFVAHASGYVVLQT